MRLLLVRHPKPDIAVGICYGHLDMDAEAADLARVVAQLSKLSAPIATASSPLKRAHQLAAAMTSQGWPAPELHDDLREMHFGDWEGRNWSDIPRDEIDAWAANTLGFIPPGGESVQQLAERSSRAIRQLFKNAHARFPSAKPDDSVMVFCHAGVLQTAQVLLRGETLHPKNDVKLKYAYGDVVDVFLEG